MHVENAFDSEFFKRKGAEERLVHSELSGELFGVL